MPRPKVPNGQKLSLMIPVEVVRRLKIEAMDAGTIPSEIVQKALEIYWRAFDGGGAGLARPLEDLRSFESTTPPPTLTIPRQHLQQLAVMDAMLAEGQFSENEFVTAIGSTPKALRAEWSKDMMGKTREVVKVVSYLISRCGSKEAFAARIKGIQIPCED